MIRHPLVAMATIGIILVCGAVRGQQPSEAPGEREVAVGEPVPGDTPCQIDEGLSLWLSLKAVDQMIADLEAERRELSAELGQVIQALDALAREQDPEGASLSDLSALVAAKALGDATIREAYANLENRLIEIDKTLTRRRGQQAMLEAAIEAEMRPPAASPR